MTIDEVQNRIIEEFAISDDWLDKYQYIVDLGNSLTDFPADEETDTNLIEGCQSKVWIVSEYVDGKVFFKAKSDAIIVKGIVVLLMRVLSGRTTDEILNSDLYFIDKIGLNEHLSPTRSNGLLSMVKQMRRFALVYKTKYENQ
ncbi:Fe-S metabolism protein SufE [Porphyromonadaceae bacterium COT-184 OH4590]|nr:Fe-S metabolism protein SufE [Porphyromonadaceae bacterium COT-184 OH4590]